MKLTGERFIPGLMGITELEHLNRYYFVVNQIDLKDKIVLDIASGEGYGSNVLSRFSKKITGVDISYEAVEHAKNKYKSENLQYIQGDAAAIPLADDSIDVVVSFETIEHHDKHTEMISEIKRILKPNGVLIISSPDKYYYSDVPNFDNEFHVKELYYKEFKTLISDNFSKSYFFSQRTFTGSIIALDEDCEQYKKPVVVEKSGRNHPFFPIYNIAIATNNSQYEISEQLVLYTEEEQAITKLDVENAEYDAILKVKNTKTWRAGMFVLLPFKLLKRIIEKSNKNT